MAWILRICGIHNDAGITVFLMPSILTPSLSSVGSPARPACALVGAKSSSKLASALAQAYLPDPVGIAASFGRWWLDLHSQQIVLALGAAAFLDVSAGGPFNIAACFRHVVAEDVPMLLCALAQSGMPGKTVHCEFRILHRQDGMRWLRLVSLPQGVSEDGIQSGVLVDITSARHAEMRERFSFESTQLLVGAHTLGDAVTKVIRLVCESLGWEWGAYWSLEPDRMGGQKLLCQHYWHGQDAGLEGFSQESRVVRMAPGQGLIGHVWSNGQATWVEGMADDKSFMRRNSARTSGLQSGYAFPVSYVTADGRRHSPGVLEFFSSQPRQREAQLPTMSAAIGALIAQTVQRLEQQEHIRHLAQIDDLTGLANRNFFYQALDQACRIASQDTSNFAVLFIDLDRFKQINDAFGHEAGNVVLREFAQRLLKLVPEGSIVGRLGGDEYAVLVTQSVSPEVLETLAQEVLLAATLPFEFERQELNVSASVGISQFPRHGCSGPELLRSADAAMYTSKKSGRNAVSFFAGGGTPQSSLVQQLTMESELRRALRSNEFLLEYQPVFDSSGDCMTAVEALIRWRRPNGEMVQPELFIQIAEKSRLIEQIGRWVVRQACRDLALLHRNGFPGLKVNVNMSAPEFIHAELPGELEAVTAAAGIESRHLCLELTEGLFMKQPEKVIPVMRALRKRGFQISLDDFGMGHSSLSRLNQLPITSLKIDRSFIKELPHGRSESAIVRTILDLGRHMKLNVIAEGVENDAQLLHLRQFGCPQVQGYFLGRPVSLTELMRLHAPNEPTAQEADAASGYP